jgi:hypothetical protein
MKGYGKEVLKIWENNSISHLSPLIIPNSVKIKQTLVVGLNPSKSYESLKSVKTKFKSEWNNDFKIRQIKGQKSYVEFLRFRNYKKNQSSIWRIQEWCHRAHRHFIKQNNFLEGVGVRQFTFIDLFPIWGGSQSNFIKSLYKKQNLKNELIKCFIKMVHENNIKRLIFLNKESFNQIKQYSKEGLMITNSKPIDVGKTRKKKIEKGFLKHGRNKINVYCVGIGGWDNNKILISKLSKSKFFD